MTGAELPIVLDSERIIPYEIILGDNEHLSRLGLDIDFKTLGDEGYVIKTFGPVIVIAGGSLRGNLYGVYGLLEDYLGCRWFTSEVNRIPQHKRLKIPRINITVIPTFEYREPYVWEAFDGDWAARNRMNRNSRDGTLCDYHGGRIEWVTGLFAHTFGVLVPPHEYFDDHPEYFSLVNGKRLKDRSQLCCTNEDVISIITEKVLQAFSENPQANVLSISQNDWDNHCECEKCQVLAEREGSQIAPVLQLVNRVAEAVEQEYPDKTISTLAYQWTRTPPKTLRPRHNVVIRLCTIECCFSHPLATCDSHANRDFARDLRAWGKITDRIWIWNYVTSFAHYFVPFPDLRARDDNMRFFADNHVTAVFQQDVYTTPHGELSGLSAYLNAKLLWNPYYDGDTAIDEFIDGVYEDAAGPIRAYIDLLHDKVEADNIHMGIWQGPDANYLTDEILACADSLWETAEQSVAGKPDVLERVQTARLSVDYAILARDRYRGDALIPDQSERKLRINPEFTARLDRFCAVADRAGVLKLKEYGTPVAEFREEIEKSVTPREMTLRKPVKNRNSGQGLTCRYYEGDWRRLPDFGSLKPKNTKTVGQFTLPDSVETDKYGVVLSGYITVVRSGIYTFYTQSSSGSKLHIGTELVVNNDGNHSVHERNGYIALQAGTHPITVSYFNRGDGAKLEVLYRGPGIDKQVIPGKVLGR